MAIVALHSGKCSNMSETNVLAYITAVSVMNKKVL